MIRDNNVLVIIPARGGSKGIKKKNVKLLGGKPLICYSIDVARTIAEDKHICVSTDDDEIITTVKNHGLEVPFRRPVEIAGDTASSHDVISHALHFFEKQGRFYDVIIYLQPTSPFRQEFHLREAMTLYSPELDMVVSAKETHSNPYYVLFEENSEGFLQKSKEGNYSRRQDCPKVWELNGAIYIINPASIKTHNSLAEFKKVKKYIMDDKYSVDIDTNFDWILSEMIIEKKLLT